MMLYRCTPPIMAKLPACSSSNAWLQTFTLPTYAALSCIITTNNYKCSSNKYYVHSQRLIYMMTARLCLADIHEIQSGVAY